MLPATALAADDCKMWALSDHVDRQGRMYGAGGVRSAVDINGSHTWCTHVIVYLLVPDPGADRPLGEQAPRQIDCAVT